MPSHTDLQSAPTINFKLTSPTFLLQLRYLADPHGNFTKQLDLLFDSAAVFGQDRSKRYALVTEDGKVKSIHVEPDNTGINGTFLVIDHCH
jgi:2-Cys peroxiredoxin 5